MISIGDWYLGPDGRWAYDENAPAPTAEPTGLLPVVASLDALHGDDDFDYFADDDEAAATDERAVPRVGDVGDWIDPNAPDPTPDEITDRDHPDYVDPWFGER